MKKIQIFILITSIVVLIAGLYIIQNNSITGNQIISITDDSGDNLVYIRGFEVLPQEISIKPGETIKWTNYNDYPHELIIEDLDFKHEMQPGEIFSLKINRKGEYNYTLSIHNFLGKINVK